MEARIDFYKILQELIDQIPENRVSTPIDLARALGDGRASRAVSEALQREEMRGDAEKIVAKHSQGVEVFREFESDRPLRRLVELQQTMSKRVVQKDDLGAGELVGGVDVAYRGDEAYTVCVVMDGRLRVVASASVKVCVRFPYIPGYLSFREAPAVEAAAERVSDFDVLLVNGHGLAHPRGCGLATHVGLDLGMATIGVARRRLVGRVGEAVDDWAPLIYEGNVVGARLKMDYCSPVYVSIGHNISLKTSLEIVRRTMIHGRLPEPLKRAHQAAEELRRLGFSGLASP